MKQYNMYWVNGIYAVKQEEEKNHNTQSIHQPPESWKGYKLLYALSLHFNLKPYSVKSIKIPPVMLGTSFIYVSIYQPTVTENLLL